MMDKITSIQALNDVRDAHVADVAMRIGKADSAGKIRKNILICGGTGCTSSNSVKISDLMKEELV